MLQLAASGDESSSVDDETRSLLQRRLALVTLVLAAIFGYAMLSNLVLLCLSAAPEMLGTSYLIPLGGGALMLATTYVLLARSIIIPSSGKTVCDAKFARRRGSGNTC